MEESLNWPNLTEEERINLLRDSEEELRFVWAPWKKFRLRLRKIGIELECDSNIPWIYLREVNGKKIVQEPFQSERLFTIAWFPIHKGKRVRLTDRRRVFQKIRESL